MLTKTQAQFLLSILNALEFRFTLNSDSLVGYIVVHGTPDELTQFLKELKEITNQLTESLLHAEEVLRNEEVDSGSN